MIYQRELKTWAAQANGVPFSAYAHLPYAEWEPIRAAYLATHTMNGAPRHADKIGATS